MSARQDAFFAAVAARRIVRPAVRAIIVRDGALLAQTPADVPSFYAFPGGEYELGDTFESRIHREIDEETTARLVTWRYLFVVESFFRHGDAEIHALEHYCAATIDRGELESRESHLAFRWLPLEGLAAIDLRPHAVRDAVADGSFESLSHLLLVDGRGTAP